MLFALTVVPLLVADDFPGFASDCSAQAVQTPISGIFSFLDNGFSYGVPLVLVALVLIGHALRERMPEFALYAGACLQC